MLRPTILAAAAALLTAAALAGCNSKGASKGNFQDALQTWWDKNPPCLSVDTFPADVDLTANPLFYKTRLAHFNALKDAGLLTAQTGPKQLPSVYGDPPRQSAQVETFSIGGSNASAWHTNERGGQTLCYAKVKVKSVDNFTEPSETMGMKATQVAYTYDLTDIADWAQNPALQEAYPGFKYSLQQPEKHITDYLVLTNNGWSKTLQ